MTDSDIGSCLRDLLSGTVGTVSSPDTIQGIVPPGRSRDGLQHPP